MTATFEEAISEISFAPSTENGAGLLPPLTRTAGHLLYLLGRLSDTPTRRPTDNQIREEIDSTKIHLTNLTIPDYLSTSTKDILDKWMRASEALFEQIATWEMETRIQNLRALCNRTIQLMVVLDRETLGLTESDAGQSL